MCVCVCVCRERENRQYTGERVDGEERLRVAAADAVAQRAVGRVVVVERVQPDDRRPVWTRLGDRGPVERARRLRPVVVDVVHLDEHVDEGAARHGARVVRVDRQPVVRLRLAVQRRLGVDHS